MTPTDLRTAIKDDLYNELRWLLCAATQWQACHVGSGGTTPHLKVYAMDSTFLHARALYEFFTATRTNNPDRLTWDDFSLPQGLSSTKYSNLISAICTVERCISTRIGAVGKAVNIGDVFSEANDEEKRQLMILIGSNWT